MPAQAPDPQILITDDARDIREPLALFLRRQGFRTRLAASAAEARRVLDETTIHLVLLDIMMPGEDGLSLCRALSAAKGPPVILLTAMLDGDDIVAGLNAGADDYVTKPFNPDELLARIAAVLRRVPPVELREGAARRRFAGIIHDADRQTVTLPDGQEAELTAGESRLLTGFLDNPNAILSRLRLLDIVRNREPGAYDRSIDNMISRLRRKIGDASRNPPLILTEWGHGYRLAVSTVEDCA
ncbi:response regulator transcription factor [Xinfangfangia sp. D13-10-4-6]|uniref:response regulator transcription factor n=1 Tax=Pseudogemmobacter hezensis TaxID=2737662 RepID=UPI00155365AA|nr:response regulator transcription factor [Pseudogemmobacter hezensis]NPD16980.1 response regulator transcription factor [Pseudogemmobacter hezensis]